MRPARGSPATLERDRRGRDRERLRPARRPTAGRGGVRPARGRARQRRRAGRASSPPSWDFAIGGACFPEVHPEAPDLETDLALPEDEGRGRRLVPDHPALLRQPGLLRLRRRGAGAGDRGADHRRRDPGRQLRPDQADLRTLRRLDPGAAGGDRSPPRRATSGPSSSSASPTPPSSAPSCCSAGAPGIHFYALNRAPATRAVLGSLQAARPWERTLAASPDERSTAH